jgi:hypothetical protein
MTDFFMTRMGQRFYESTMPGLVKQLADLNENLKRRLPEGWNDPRQEPHDSDGRESPLVADAKRAVNGKVAGPPMSILAIAEERELMLKDFREAEAKTRKTEQSEPHKISRPSTDEEILASDNRVIREGFERSRRSVMGEVTHSEAVTMLLNLLARIHRDGGHHTEEVGLTMSVYDADMKVAEQNAWAGRVDRDTMYRADLNSLAENDEPCHTDAGTRVRNIIAELRGTVQANNRTFDTLQQERDELWSENQRLKGLLRQSDFERELRSRAEENLTIEKDAHHFTRQLHAAALQRGVDLEAKINLITMSDLKKLELVNTKLGISINDTYAHFREQLNNALDDD